MSKEAYLEAMAGGGLPPPSMAGLAAQPPAPQPAAGSGADSNPYAPGPFGPPGTDDSMRECGGARCGCIACACCLLSVVVGALRMHPPFYVGGQSTPYRSSCT